MYRDPIYVAFRQQMDNAKRRGIVWMLTFEQWWGIWEASGKWKRRGKYSGQFCMARFKDEGPYSIINVQIITVNRNHQEMAHPSTYWTGKQFSDSHRAKIGKAHKNKKHTEKTKKKISKSNKGRIPGFLGKHHSEETKVLKRKTWRNQYGYGPNNGGK